MNNTRIYGVLEPVNKSKDIYLKELATNFLHIWTPNSKEVYLQSSYGLEKSEDDVLVSKTVMTQCPTEMSYNGVCKERWLSEDHRSKYYHYATVCEKGVFCVDVNGVEYPTCKYTKNKCWEYDNILHRNIFYHF